MEGMKTNYFYFYSKPKSQLSLKIQDKIGTEC